MPTSITSMLARPLRLEECSHRVRLWPWHGPHIRPSHPVPQASTVFGLTTVAIHFWPYEQPLCAFCLWKARHQANLAPRALRLAGPAGGVGLACFGAPPPCAGSLHWGQSRLCPICVLQIGEEPQPARDDNLIAHQNSAFACVSPFSKIIGNGVQILFEHRTEHLVWLSFMLRNRRFRSHLHLLVHKLV